MPRARADEFDVTLLAARGQRLERQYGLDQLPRLAGLGAGPATWIRADLGFGLTDRRVHVTGAVAGHVDLECQRCLGRCRIPIDAGVDLTIVGSEDEMNAVAEPSDAVVGDAHRLDIGWLIEEETLLHLPLVPRHEPDDEQCAAQIAPPSSAERRPSTDTEREQPFAKLRDLLDKS
jgi:uncharacterized metal-binding protein YceD (DUF177 family)